MLYVLNHTRKKNHITEQHCKYLLLKLARIQSIKPQNVKTTTTATNKMSKRLNNKNLI